MKAVIAAALCLACSCHSRCNARTAAYDKVPPGSICNGQSDFVLCFDGARKVVWYCAIDGAFSFDARCSQIGDVTAEVRP